MNHFCWKIQFFRHLPKLVGKKYKLYMGYTDIRSSFQGHECFEVNVRFVFGSLGAAALESTVSTFRHVGSESKVPAEPPANGEEMACFCTSFVFPFLVLKQHFLSTHQFAF